MARGVIKRGCWLVLSTETEVDPATAQLFATVVYLRTCSICSALADNSVHALEDDLHVELFN